MKVMTTKDLFDHCDGNQTHVAHYCQMNRGTVRKHLAANGLIVVDGEVYIKHGKVNNHPYDGVVKYGQYMELVETLLQQTGSIDTCAELLCEAKTPKTRREERRCWVKRITAWIGQEKIVT
jgi:hypothetical protein